MFTFASRHKRLRQAMAIIAKIGLGFMGLFVFGMMFQALAECICHTPPNWTLYPLLFGMLGWLCVVVVGGIANFFLWLGRWR
jgi:hypothetical protein